MSDEPPKTSTPRSRRTAQRPPPRKITTIELVGLILAVALPTLALVLGAPAAAGVVQMSQARIWLAAACLLTVAGAFVIEYLSGRAWKRIITTSLVSAVLIMGFSLVFYRQIGEMKAEQESNRIPGPKRPQPEPRVDVYIPFGPAHDKYEKQLGNARLKEQPAGDAPELHEQERATVFWSQGAGYYILKHDDAKWIHREDRPWPRGDWWSIEFVNKTLPNLNCPKPPLGGLAVRWYKEPKEWEWIGCTDWNCFCGPNNVFIQEFDGGTLIGPLRRSYDNDNVGDVAVLLSDGTYHRVNFDGEIPACRNPEKP